MKKASHLGKDAWPFFLVKVLKPLFIRFPAKKNTSPSHLRQAIGDTYAARNAGVVEPVFANICVHKHMHRFTLRSKTQGGCTMEIVRSGTQYWQNPHFWGALVASSR